MFPVSDNSQTIVDCLLQLAQRNGVQILKGTEIEKLNKVDDLWQLDHDREHQKSFDKVIVATGGSPKRKGLEWLAELGHRIEDPVPSLFTFNLPNAEITFLSGVSVQNAFVNILGTKHRSSGPLLITHWGLSGPAVLKLSSFAARDLNSMDYEFDINVNWLGERNEDRVRSLLLDISKKEAKKLMTNAGPDGIPERLWTYLLERCQIDLQRRWAEIGNKTFNKLTSLLCADQYRVSGKTTFKEEFVTCGGVDLRDIDMKTMESKICPGLYFTGEVMDIDAITGGYNFQAAWTTAFIAAKLNTKYE